MRVGALATSVTSQVSPQVTLALEEYERIFGSQPYYWAATRCLSVWSVDTRQHWVIVSSKKPRSQGCLANRQQDVIPDASERIWIWRGPQELFKKYEKCFVTMIFPLCIWLSSI